MHACMHDAYTHTNHSQPHLGGQMLGQLMLPNHRKIKDV